MSGDMRNGGPDRSLEQDLAALRAAWRELQQEEPPDLLDQSVRNAARRALSTRSRRRSMRWLGSLATAAVVVLAVAIVIQQDQEGPTPPVPKSDGYRLDKATSAEKRASDATEAEQEPGRAELMLQRAPSAAAESPTPREETIAPAALDEAMESDATLPTPEDWVQRLLQLEQEGRDEELRLELNAFREAYPDYPLPPELQE
jgi:hypothetical protein